MKQSGNKTYWVSQQEDEKKKRDPSVVNSQSAFIKVGEIGKIAEPVNAPFRVITVIVYWWASDRQIMSCMGFKWPKWEGVCIYSQDTLQQAQSAINKERPLSPSLWTGISCLFESQTMWMDYSAWPTSNKIIKCSVE